MTIESVWAQVEQELLWRTDEIRLLSNTRNSLRREADQDRFRRAQLVMLYAHAEGFCKVSLLIYLRALNALKIKRSAASDQLVVASFEQLFHALHFGDKKGKVFRRTLPTDENLHVFSRQAEFISELESFMDGFLVVPETAVDTESNLSSTVIRRNLFRLGFHMDLLNAYSVHLDELAHRRHNIAHGTDDAVVRSADYDRLQEAAFRAMNEIGLAIIDSLQNCSYLKDAGPRFTATSLSIGEMR